MPISSSCFSFSNLARFFALIGIFSLLAFPVVGKIAFPAAAILALISADFRQHLYALKAHRFVVTVLLLLILFAMGVAYSHVPFDRALVGFFKYNKLLYLIFLLPLFVDLRWRRIATNVLIVSVMLDILISLLALHGLITINKLFYPGGYTEYAISTSAILAFVAFVLGNRVIDEPRYRWLYITLFLIATYVLFFSYVERTGQVLFLVLLGLVLWQRLGWKGFGVSLIAIPLAASFFFLVSHSFQHKIEKGYTEVVQYMTTRESHGSSLGDRLAFAEYSWQVIKQRPLLGSGTGSFAQLYATTEGPVVRPGTLLQDPHNEYVMITFQLGFIGLLVFLGMLWMQWQDSKKLPLNDRRLAQAVVLSLVTVNFTNTALFIGLSGLFYVVFSAIYFAAVPKPTLTTHS